MLGLRSAIIIATRNRQASEDTKETVIMLSIMIAAAVIIYLWSHRK